MAKRKAPYYGAFTKRRKTQHIGWRQFIPYGVAAAGKFAESAYGYLSKKRVSSGSGVTSQYDKTTQYRKGRMPRRKKKQWKKFVRRVRRALEKDLGKTTVVFNHLQNNVNGGIVTAGTDQGRSECHLYGFQGTADTSTASDGISGAADIANICNTDTRIGPSSKVKFCSGVLDVTFRSTSTNIELDIYEIVYRRDTDANDVITMLNNGFTNTSITGYPNTLATVNRGVTLFDCPPALSAFGIKILKKTKYFIPNGSTATYQIRDPKTHVFDASTNDISTTTTGLALSKMTRSLFYIWKALPGDATVATISVGVTRKYSYQLMEDSIDYDGRIP